MNQPATILPFAAARSTTTASLAQSLADALEAFMLCRTQDGSKCAPNDSDFARAEAALDRYRSQAGISQGGLR